MAISLRNQLGDTNDSLDKTEAIFGQKSGVMYGTQPFAVRDGRAFEVTSRDLLNGNNWILTAVTTTGVAVNAISATSATLPERVVLTTGTTAHDNLQIQFGQALTMGSATVAAATPFVIRSGFNTHFKCRFRVTTTAADAAFFLGLANVDTTILASSVISTNAAIGALKAASGITTNGHIRTGASGTSTALTTAFTINTWYEFGFVVQGTGSVVYFWNGVETGASSLTNIPANTDLLTPTFAISTGAGAAATLELSGMYAWEEMV